MHAAWQKPLMRMVTTLDPVLSRAAPEQLLWGLAVDSLDQLDALGAAQVPVVKLTKYMYIDSSRRSDSANRTAGKRLDLMWENIEICNKIFDRLAASPKVRTAPGAAK
jgi:hypothetical protein